MSALVDRIARAICESWEYLWDGDPDLDEQVAPETNDGFDERPSKELFREAARNALTEVAQYLERAAGIHGQIIVDHSVGPKEYHEGAKAALQQKADEFRRLSQVIELGVPSLGGEK